MAVLAFWHRTSEIFGKWERIDRLQMKNKAPEFPIPVGKIRSTSEGCKERNEKECKGTSHKSQCVGKERGCGLEPERKEERW